MKPLSKATATKIEKLISVSREIIHECALENGAIVAANSTKKRYPVHAKNYFYVWPRDAAFTCMAADILGVDSIQENFFSWCLDRAEGFSRNGIFYEKYYPNGLKALWNFQPDQTGSVLVALWHHYKNKKRRSSKFHDLVDIAANGICNVWEQSHFTVVINDLWEERFCFPDLDENFSYSLAACVGGLECANEFLPTKRWIKTATAMRNRLDEHYMDFFARSFGKIPDRRIDASMMGLVYPFQVYAADDPRMVATIGEIEKKLAINGGIHRYEHDEYDGWMYETTHRKKGAGAWPLLNFWLSIYYSVKGDPERARNYYTWVLKRTGDHIPEQIFENDIQVSVSPLLWSHAMFILASSHLGLI